MSSISDRFPTNPTGDKLLEELRRFFQASANARAGNEVDFKESVRIGLWLLRHLPVARDSVFEVISAIYKEFVHKHLSSVEQNDGVISLLDEEIDEFLKDIHSTFLLYLDSCGEIWSPILSNWALHLLGQLSTSTAKRAIFSRTQSVNEVITIWMGSKAIQSLLTITSRCLTCQGHSETDSFISILLDTSAAHSPHFDWVVAHVGNTYPQTVVNEVLNLGLNNFSAGPTPHGSKLSSVAGILGHLSTTHAKEVQNSFDQMIQSVLSGVIPLAERHAIPYLLQLSASSIPLLDVLMDSILPKIKEDTIIGMQPMIHLWMQLHFGKNPHALVSLATHLILKSNRGPTALEILVNAIKTWRFLGTYAKMLLKNFLVEISSLLYESSSLSYKDLVKNFPCISALKEKVDILMKYLTDPDIEIARFAKQIVKLISFHDGDAVGVQTLVHYFRFSETDAHIWILTDLISSLEMKYPKILGNALRQLVIESRLFPVDQTETHLRPWKTLFRLVRTESEGKPKLPIKVKFSSVIRENLNILATLLDSRKQQFRMDEALVLLGILAHIPDITSGAAFGTLLKVERFLVELLFRILAIESGKVGRGKKLQQVSHISKLLRQLCTKTAQAIQNDALRSLVQTCLNPECRHLFQRTKRLSAGTSSGEALLDDDEFEPYRLVMYSSLLQDNQKRTATVSMNRTHSTSFHSGKLPNSNRSSGNEKVTILDNEDHELNVLLFLSSIISVCMATPSNGRELPNGVELKNGKLSQWRESSGNDTSAQVDPEVSVEAMRKVALLLVEIVSPDVMFNGLPWPEEDFSKVQVERDLKIRRGFEDHPYLWDMLELVANYCPSLCYCSVLLRALMATFISNWTSSQKAKANLFSSLLNSTIRLINIMKVGQLIPPPLCHIGLVIAELRANEVVALLRDIWWYMKVHVPIPTRFINVPQSNRFVRDAEFSQVPSMYTERLRLTLINNAETIGYLYPKLFPIQKPSSPASPPPPVPTLVPPL